MVDVPDHLAPRHGISDASIRFAGYDSEGRATIVRFEIAQGKRVVGAFSFEVDPTAGASIDHAVALGHQRMNDALRQMLHENELLRQVYARRSA